MSFAPYPMRPTRSKRQPQPRTTKAVDSRKVVELKQTSTYKAATRPSKAQAKVQQPRQLTVAPIPWWLNLLLFLQYSSAALAVGLVGATLAIYGNSVSSQRAWDQEYDRLITLRRTERQLLASSELIKHQAAEQSSQSRSLVYPKPSQRVYVSVPSPQPAPVPVPVNRSPSPAPLGY